MTAHAPSEAIAIPASHLDLLTRPIRGVLTSMLPDGQPHSALVPTGFDGECAVVVAALTDQVEDMGANPKVSLMVVDPDDTDRFIQIRGDAEFVSEGETGARWRIHARRITLDAIHA